MPEKSQITQNAVNVRRDGDVVLRDGSTVHIRVMSHADEARLCALLTSLSEESRWLRFYCLQNSAGLAAEAHREANLDQAFGLIACSGDEDRVVGHAPGGQAEFAVAAARAVMRVPDSLPWAEAAAFLNVFITALPAL